ncbi:MAG: J domain-containing protein [Cyclobacteriaceae bacterium]|nr:J domain-containing protein [Cyclobacteriaceae bacterium]
MKNYYQILRISRTANDAEIKRAFRRLAIVFHPDKNPSPQSSSLFQEINEAHEVLSDPEKRFRYDQLLNSAHIISTPPPPQRYHRDPAYRKKQQAGYRPKPYQPSERLLMMAHLLRYLRLISLIGIGWCGALVIDYMLPFRISEEKVLSEAEAIGLRESHHTPYVVVTNKNHQFPVSAEGSKHFDAGSTATVISSRILNLMVKVESQDKLFTITSLGSVYQNFMFMPVILLALSIAGLKLKTGLEFRFSVQVAICTLMFFNLIFLIVSIL